MKISIDKDKCIKCGLCASMCPEVFVLREDGSIEVIYKDENSIGKKDDKKLIDNLEMVETSCPVKAITIEDKPNK